MLNRRYPRVALIATVLAVAVGCSGSDATPSPTIPPNVTATPSRVTSPAPTATGTPLPTFDGVEPIVLVPGEPVQLPPGVVLYAYDAPYESPSPVLRRYYYDGSGRLRSDDLVVSTGGPTGDVTRGIVGVVTGLTVSNIATALCHGSCYGDAQPVTVIRSSDGGVTWTEAGMVEKGDWGTLIGMDGERVYVRDWSWYGGVDEVYPLGDHDDAIPVPGGYDPDINAIAIHSAGGFTLAILDEDDRTLRDLHNPGHVITRIPLPATASVNTWGVGVIEYDGAPFLHVNWSGWPGSGNNTSYLGLVDMETGEFRTVLQSSHDGGVSGVYITVWLTPTLALGSAGFYGQNYSAPGSVNAIEEGGPVLIDLEAATVSPIAEWVDMLSGKAGGPVPVAIAIGPFARVVDAGTCLNVREAPSTDAPILACYADSVLLPVRTGTETVDGETWIAVTTLDGRDGYAAKAYLEVAWP